MTLNFSLPQISPLQDRLPWDLGKTLTLKEIINVMREFHPEIELVRSAYFGDRKLSPDDVIEQIPGARPGMTIVMDFAKINHALRHAVDAAMKDIEARIPLIEKPSGVECPICNGRETEFPEFCQIKACKHMFHRKCLFQKTETTARKRPCPTCGKLFKFYAEI